MVRKGIGNAIVLFLTMVVIVVAALAAAMVPGASSGTDTSIATATPSSTEGEVTFLVRVVQESSMSPIAGITVLAGPISTPNDAALTPGGPTISECVHEVPNGATVDGDGMVVYDGRTTTFAPCPLKDYVTNSTGWVSITNATGDWYFIRAGNVNEWNDIVMGIIPNGTVSIGMPLPSGNVTVPWSLKSCTTGWGNNVTATCIDTPGNPIYWPPTTKV